MMKEFNRFQKDAIKAIAQIKQEFQKNPHIFLNERDIQCYLYHLLAGKYCVPRKTKNPEIRSFNLHAEIPFGSKKSGRLDKRCDLTYEYLPSLTITPNIDFNKLNLTRLKDWELKGGAVGIEIKFNNHTRKKGTNKFRDFYNLILNDLQKLNEFDKGIFLLVDQFGLLTPQDIEELKKNSRARRTTKFEYCSYY